MRTAGVVILLVNLVVASSAQGQDSERKRAAQGDKPPKNVAIFLFNDVQIIDYTGPYEVFINANYGGRSYFNVFTVAAATDPINTVGDMTVIPKYRFDKHPKVDVLVVPGGWGVWAARKDPKVITWIQDTAKNAEVVLSVCNGTVILSKAGLLDGTVPAAKMLKGKRFVEDGKLVVAGGMSSGIDGALHVVEKMLGKGWAQMVAVWIEFDWQSSSKFARALFADNLLPPPINIGDAPGVWTPISYAGGIDHWENRARLETEWSAKQVRESIDATLVKWFKWSKQPTKDEADGGKSFWTLQDKSQRKWRGVVTVEPIPGAKPAFEVVVRVDLDQESP